MFFLAVVLMILATIPTGHAYFSNTVEEKEIDAVGNPYHRQERTDAVDGKDGTEGDDQDFSAAATGSSGDANIHTICKPHLETLIDPRHLIVQTMQVQADTFLEMTEAKVFSVPIPVYRMKQPSRLSEAELEFQMVLVKDLNKYGTGIVTSVPVEMEKAADSWFPGYFWSPLVMQCGPDSDVSQHVGWKFERLARNATLTLPHFYAVLVEVTKKERTNTVAAGVYVGGFQAPGWMASAVQ